MTAPDGPDAELTTVGQDTAADDTPAVGRTDWTVPTMDDMRAKLDARSATAAGQAELDALSGVGRDQVQSVEDRERAAQERLAAIRASMGD
jgi:phage shock protein A